MGQVSNDHHAHFGILIMLRSSGTTAGDYRATHYNGVDPASIYRWENPATGRTTIVAELSDGSFRIKMPGLFPGLLNAFPHDDLLLRHAADLK